MNGHEDYDGLAVGFALDALEPDDERRFRDHLLTCERCALTVDEALAIAGELALAAPLEAPPESLRLSLGEAIRRTPQGAAPLAPDIPAARDPRFDRGEPVRLVGPPADGAGRPADAEQYASVTELRGGHPHRSRAGGRRRMAQRILAAAAAVIVVIGLAGVSVVQSHRVSDRQRALAQQQQVLRVLTDPAARTVGLAALAQHSGSARVIVANGRAFVVTDGLTPNATNATYVLWAVRSTTPLRAAGVRAFDVGTGKVAVIDAGPVNPTVAKAGGYAVSLEPGRAVPAAPTDIVLSG